MIRKLILFAAPWTLLLLAGCATMSSAARNVEVFDELSDVAGCTELGTLWATGSNVGGGYNLFATRGVNVKIREMAAKMGGDTLLLTVNSDGLFSGSKREGTVYRCGDRTPAQATAPTPATTH
jgi:hypothetical protein